MTKNSKIDFNTKLKVVKEYIAGKKSLGDIKKDINISKEQIRRWVKNYELSGEEGLKPKSKHKCYSRETKLNAIKDYLSGEYSQFYVCTKYEISSVAVLQRWIMLYNNNHNITESYIKKRNVIMIKSRKTTLEERVEIVSFCIANNLNYELTSNKYKVSYNQIYTWVKKYKKSGYEGLEDRRGKAKEIESMDEKEKLGVQMKLLKAENERLKMEVDFLKKLEQIERR